MRKSVETEVERFSSSTMTIKEYFKTEKDFFLMNKPYFLTNDPNSDISYFLSDPLIIVSNENMKIIDSVKLPPKFKFDRDNKCLSFTFDKKLFFMIFDQQIFYIYSITDKNHEAPYIEYHMPALKSDEEIMKVHLIQLEQSAPLFLVSTNYMRSFLMKIVTKYINYKEVTEYEIYLDEIKEKVGIFQNFYKTFIKKQGVSESLFILIPNSKKFLKTSEELNKAFIMTETSLQRIDFNLNGPKIGYEITSDINLNNVIIGGLKSHFKTTMDFSPKSFLIEDAQIFYSTQRETYNIQFILKLDREDKLYFLFFQIEINLSGFISDPYVISIYNLNSGQLYRVSLLYEKTKDEGIVIFYHDYCTMILLFNDSKKKSDRQIHHKINFELNGYCGFKVNNDSPEITLFSINDGYLNIVFKNEAHLVNITSQLLNCLLEKPLEISKSESQSTSKYENFSESRTDEGKLLSFFSDLFSLFLAQKSNINEEEKLKGKLSELNIDSRCRILELILISIIDDETENIDMTDRESIKAEISIIEYLRAKQYKLSNFFTFCDKLLIFDDLDSNGRNFYTFLLYIEKLGVAIELRQIENDLIEEKTNFKNFSNYLVQFKQIFNKAFTDVKLTLNLDQGTRAKNFVKRCLYSKISKIENYLKQIVINLKFEVENVKKDKNEKFRILLFYLNLMNLIIEVIRDSNEIYKYRFLENYKYLNINKDYFWLIDSGFFLKEFLDLFDIYFKIEGNKLDENESKIIVSYAENILFLCKIHFEANFEPKNKDWEKVKTKIIENIYKKDFRFALNLAVKYVDYYSIVKICHERKLINELKENMKTFNDFVPYALRQYLVFIIQSNLPSNTNSFYFNYFEDFSEFKNELEEFVSKHPQIAFLYSIFKANYQSKFGFSYYFFNYSFENDEDRFRFYKISKLIEFKNEKEKQVKKFGAALTSDLEMIGEEDETGVSRVSHENDFYMCLTYIKIKFQLDSKSDFVDIITKLMLIPCEAFGGLVKKYFTLISMVFMSKPIVNSTHSQSTNAHLNIVNNLYEKIIVNAFTDDIIFINFNLEEKKTNYKLKTFGEMSDEQRKDIVSGSILNNLKERFFINLDTIESLLSERKDTYISNEINEDKIEKYLSIYSLMKKIN